MKYSIQEDDPVQEEINEELRHIHYQLTNLIADGYSDLVHESRMTGYYKNHLQTLFREGANLKYEWFLRHNDITDATMRHSLQLST